jgi:hypothetical protein
MKTLKTYQRNQAYWEEVRLHVLSRAQAWTRGSEGRALMALGLADDWEFSLMQYAPAGEHIPPADCAAVIIRNYLILG